MNTKTQKPGSFCSEGVLFMFQWDLLEGRAHGHFAETVAAEK